MLTLNELNNVHIDTAKFKKVFLAYYSFFKDMKGVDISELLPKDMEYNNLPIFSHNDPMEFFLDISTEINSVYTDHELKKNGQFHTKNYKIINLILNKSIDFNDINFVDKKILEPSCGTGLFLLTIIKKLYDEGYSEKKLINFVNNNLVGFDISAEMVYFTRLNIFILMSYLFNKIEMINILQPQIYISDATYKAESNNKQLNLFDEGLNFIESKEAHDIKFKSINDYDYKFDYIVGNPPYITLYGRRAMKKTEELRNYYIKNYEFVPSNVINGKFNITMFFFEQSLNWIKEGGVISFIVDTSLFETAYKDLRKYILENSKINYLITDLSVFDGVGSGQVIITIQKSSDLSNNLNNKVNIINYKTKKKNIVHQEKWYKEEENKFLIIDDLALNILNKIDKKSVELVTIYPKKSLRTCTMMLDMENRFTHPKKIDSFNEVMPYYEGSKSLKTKFGKLTHEKYFEYNKDLQDKINEELKEELTKKGIKNKKRIGLGNLEMFKSPKIFIRQSATSLIATLSFEPAAANNSLYCLSDIKDTENSRNNLKITCAQLNSTILTFYALSKRIIRVSNGKQPQIKVSDLKKIRLTLNVEVTEKLLEITEEILAENIDTIKGIEKIDNILFNYYGITKQEQEYISSIVKSH